MEGEMGLMLPCVQNISSFLKKFFFIFSQLKFTSNNTKRNEDIQYVLISQI